MTLVFEGYNLVFFLTLFALALFVSLNDFSRPKVPMTACPLHPGVKECVHRKQSPKD